MAALVEQAPQMGTLGEFFLRCFGPFEFRGIEPAPPGETFSGELAVRVGDREVHLLEAGPAHTQGDTMAWLASERVLLAGDLLFNGSPPPSGAGPGSDRRVGAGRTWAGPPGRNV